jgi:hypothetical protein
MGAVYIVRDPRDVAVSFAHHLNETINQAIDLMNNPKAKIAKSNRHIPRQLPQHLYTWSQHSESWLDAPVKLLLLKYEDMLNEPLIQFGEVARFLGLKAGPEVVSAAVSAVSFERLRADEQAKGFIERQPDTECFFRRGIAGGWQDSLTPEQIARIEADHGPMMRRLGYL